MPKHNLKTRHVVGFWTQHRKSIYLYDGVCVEQRRSDFSSTCISVLQCAYPLWTHSQPPLTSVQGRTQCSARQLRLFHCTTQTQVLIYQRMRVASDCFDEARPEWQQEAEGIMQNIGCFVSSVQRLHRVVESTVSKSWGVWCCMDPWLFSVAKTAQSVCCCCCCQFMWLRVSSSCLFMEIVSEHEQAHN